MLELLTTLTTHEGRVWHASWSPDGQKIASCGEDKVICLWEFDVTKSDKNWECIATLEEGQTRTIRSCEWSPDGNMIASASFDGSVVIWKSQSKTFRNWEKIASLEGHDSEVKSVAWNCDGNYLATCGRDKKVWIWERLLDGDFECVAMLDGHSQDVKFVRWHPTMKVLFSCGYDDVIKIWMDDNDDWYCVNTLKGHVSTVWGVAMDSTGSRLLSVSADKSAILWECDSQTDAAKEWRITFKLQGVHSYDIYSVDWGIEHGLIATGGGDNSIKISRLGKCDDGNNTLDIEYINENSHNGDVNCVRWRSGGDLDMNYQLLSCSDDGSVKIWRYIASC